jgi:outer membrane lipoprotein-sorting protein
MRSRALLATALLAAALAGPARAADLDVHELVKRVEERLRRSSSEMVISMTVETPRWTRTLRFRSWDDRAGDRSFTRILEPAKDRGTGFLKIGDSLWTYLPSVERVTRMPPSLLLQPWMGSDFTNDDIVRESSLIDDYEPRYLGEQAVDGVACHRIELLARETAPVVWARLEAWADVQTLVPVRFVYFDEGADGALREVRAMAFADVRDVQGTPFPHRWQMVPSDKPGHRTLIRVEEVRFDVQVDASLFTQEHLKRAEAVR